MNNLKNRTLARAAAYGWRVMPAHFTGLLAIDLLAALLPLAGIAISRQLYRQVEGAGLGALSARQFLPVVAGYLVYLAVMKLYPVFYKRVHVQFSALPRFEKKIKTILHEKCAQVGMWNYETPAFFNNVWEAKVASMNIYRIVEYIIDAAAMVLGIVVMGGYLATIHPLFWILILLAAIPSFTEKVIEGSLSDKSKSRSAEFNKREKAWYACLTDTKYLPEIKAYRCLPLVQDKWEESARQSLAIARRNGRMLLRVKLVTGLCKAGATIGIFLACALLFLRGSIGFDGFMATLSAATYLQSQYTELFDGAGYCSMFLALVKPYFQFLDSKNDVRKPARLAALSVRDLSYQYPTSAQPVLRHINLEVKPGQTVVIVGANGAGKSTLSKVLLGLLAPSAGRMVVNDCLALGGPQESFAFSNVCVMLQDFCRYDLTVAENITVGCRQDGDSGRLAALLTQVGLPQLTGRLEDGLGKNFGGADLSGGQWQRLALARCLYRAGDFYVLDEPTGAIDPIHEKALNDLMFEQARGKTLLIISHRLSVARRADRVFVLSNGGIAESGSHQSLMQGDTLYRRMWQAQADWYAPAKDSRGI